MPFPWHDNCKSIAEVQMKSGSRAVLGHNLSPSGDRVAFRHGTVNAGQSRPTGWTVLRHKSSQTLFDYWNMIRNGRPAPERSEVEPGDLRHILGDTFILEIAVNMRAISYRLAGTRLCAAYGRELKGHAYLAHWREEDNYAVAKAIHGVYQSMQPTVLAYTARSETGRFVEYESILLPLLPAADGNARILGVTSAKKAPYWLGADPLCMNHLRSVREIDVPADAPAMVTTLPEKGWNNLAKPRKHAHLTVLDGGLATRS